MTKINVTVEINRPASEVFEYISDPENNPKWQSGMQEAVVTSEGPLGVGSTYTQVAKFLGRRIESNFEIVEYEPGRKVKGATVSGSFPIQFTRTVEPTENGCRASALVEGEAGGFFKLFGPLLDRMVKKSIEGDYANLKRILEALPNTALNIGGTKSA